MIHRHLDNPGFSGAAIDDIISRGAWEDWADLRQAVINNPALLDRVEQICRHYTADPYAQRYHFWMHYVKKHKTAA
ncbi:hypothetical protein OH491_24190 [Termitidicoccus mucosus]|uniref:Uncharacterized protein n=1 Tax=Termitidicoccus mucosus TaxID=1184151 RepID=A0A178IQG8_9BACT|nr:hypothetical protein AW736_02265 [Opitutaceae bacterium TSB47]